MANRYWILGTGNWSDTAHWSTSSGGSGGASVPTSSDSVYFDANSFTGASQTVTIDATANCLDMDWTGATNSPTLAGSSTLNVYGNLIFISGMSVTKTNSITFKSTTTGKTITTANLSLVASFVFSGVGGEWTLQDDVNVGTFQTDNGSIITNNKNITCVAFSSSNSNTRSINLGSSTITVSSNVIFTTTTNLTFSAKTSTIIMTGNTKTFNGGGLTWYNLELQGTPTTITGSNTFVNKFKILDGKTVDFTSGTTQTILNLFESIGSTSNNVTIQSTSAGSAATISKPAGKINVKNCSIKDITATGGATFNAVTSTSVSGNSGWNFVSSVSVGQLGQATPDNSGLVALATVAETYAGLDASKALTAYGFTQAWYGSGSSLPTASSSIRGKLFLLLGGTGVADVIYVCRKKTDETYEWGALL